jgi:arylsulfatase A-like enzyme
MENSTQKARGRASSWYGQASCTAGRASFMTGRIPVRSALSVVVVPGDENGLTKSPLPIAEFFQKNGYGTYASGLLNCDRCGNPSFSTVST